MKKILLAAVVLFMVSFANVQVSAQILKGSNKAIRVERNPVKYSSIEAFSDGRGVRLEWKTEIESKNLGFYVYRIVGGQRELISPILITGAYLQSQAEKITSGNYSFFDRFGDVNSIYVIESYNVNGQKHYSASIQTQFVNDLASVAGVSSDELINQSRNARPDIVRNESLLPKDLASEVEVNGLQADPITQRWVAAQPGVKIGVKTEGLYRVSRAELQAAGFNVNAPTELWQLYVNGVEQAIITGANGDFIEFYGKGIDTNEADTQTYFLVVGPQNGKRIRSTFIRRIGASVVSQSYSQSFYKRERFIYTSNPLNGDVENFFGSILSTTPTAINFNLSGVYFSKPTASIDVTINGITLVSHQFRVTLNNVELGTLSGIGYNSISRRFDIPTSALRDGANSLQFVSLNGSGDVSLFTSMKINFARRYQAEQNRLSFFVPNYKANYVENFTSPNIRVFDTTNPDAPSLISGLSVEQSGGNYRVYLPSSRGRVLFAVENSAISQASSVTPNAPSTLSTAANSGSLVILSYKDWMTQAEDWANYRRAQGMNVKVVNIEDVFDEFNYGVLNADSIRAFLQYAKSNWQTPPSYLLMIGDATYDPKNYQGYPMSNFVPTRLVDTIYTETGSDDTLADFNNDGLAEIAVGRIPARNAATVTLALNKVMTFEQTVGQASNRGVIFASDLPNGYDFEALSNRLGNQLPGNIPRIMINRAAPSAQAQLVSEMNNGRFLVNYSGHGNVGVWAAGSFFSSSNAAQLTNSNNLSIFTMLTCLNGYFIQPDDSLSEVLLKNPNGGSVATWSSTGLTTADIQEVMATRFYNQVAAGNITRLGDLINDAKTTIAFGRDVRLSWVLLGDPTLKMK